MICHDDYSAQIGDFREVVNRRVIDMAHLVARSTRFILFYACNSIEIVE